MKKRIAYLIMGIFLMALSSYGQNQATGIASAANSETSVNLVRTIQLDKDSKTEEVFIEVKPKTQKLQLQINSTIFKGKLTIELYDPGDVKQGNFSIGTQLNSEKSETVNGNITKVVTEPQAGKWKIKMIPTDASGMIRVHSSINE
jgi:subtilisin-like proprotein convertase family protein